MAETEHSDYVELYCVVETEHSVYVEMYSGRDGAFRLCRIVLWQRRNIPSMLNCIVVETEHSVYVELYCGGDGTFRLC